MTGDGGTPVRLRDDWVPRDEKRRGEKRRHFHHLAGCFRDRAKEREKGDMACERKRVMKEKEIENGSEITREIEMTIEIAIDAYSIVLLVYR